MATVVFVIARREPAVACAFAPLREPVEAVVANDHGVVALTRTQAVLLDGDGVPLRRLGLGEPSSRRRPGRATRRDDFAATAGVLDDDDFNDPHDSDSEVEDPENILASDDAVGRRREPVARLVTTAGLAIGGRFGWVSGGADGLLRIDLDDAGVTRAVAGGAPGLTEVAASADGRYVATAGDRRLLRSRDGGATFDAAVALVGPARSVAVTSRGTIFVIDGSGLRRLAASATQPQALELPDATEVTSCGPEVVVRQGRWLTAIDDRGDKDGILEVAGDLVAPDVLDRRAAPPETERLVCSADGGVWLSFQPGLWVSVDRGRSWAAREEASPAPVTTVAITPQRIWLGGAAGLYGLPIKAGSALAPPRSPANKGMSSVDSRAPAWRWWMSVLPRIDLDFAVARSSSRRDVRAFFLLTFLLDGRRGWTNERRRLAVEQARRRLAERFAWATEGCCHELDCGDAAERDALVQARAEDGP